MPVFCVSEIISQQSRSLKGLFPYIFSLFLLRLGGPLPRRLRGLLFLASADELA
jgi:hypothetical protein